MIKKPNILKVKLFSVFWESFHIFGESLVKQFDCDCVKKRLVVCNKTKMIWQQLAELKKKLFCSFRFFNRLITSLRHMKTYPYNPTHGLD